MGFIFFTFVAVSIFCILFVLIKNAVKNGVKEALQDLQLVDKAALRTIDTTNRDGNNDNTGSYV